MAIPDRLRWQGYPDGAVTTEFSVGERRFTVEIVPRRGPHSYTAGFYDEDGRITLTGRGDAHRVIARALAALEEFIGIYDPEEIWFHALRSEPSRVKLYRSLVDRVNRGRLFAGYRGEVVEDAKQIGFRIFSNR
jgi:hypothetical protein